MLNSGSCFIAHSLGMGLFLSVDGPALGCEWVNFSILRPRMNEVKVNPWALDFCLDQNSRVNKYRQSSLSGLYVVRIRTFRK